MSDETDPNGAPTPTADAPTGPLPGSPASKRAPDWRTRHLAKKAEQKAKASELARELQEAQKVKNFAEISSPKPVLRDERGKIAKGSGYLVGSGRKQLPEELVDAARRITPAALQALAVLVRKGNSDSSRLRAAELILKAAHLEPVQQIQITGDPTKMADSDLHLAAAQILNKIKAQAQEIEAEFISSPATPQTDPEQGK